MARSPAGRARGFVTVNPGKAIKTPGPVIGTPAPNPWATPTPTPTPTPSSSLLIEGFRLLIEGNPVRMA